MVLDIVKRGLELSKSNCWKGRLFVHLVEHFQIATTIHLGCPPGRKRPARLSRCLATSFLQVARRLRVEVEVEVASAVRAERVSLCVCAASSPPPAAAAAVRRCQREREKRRTLEP